MQCDKVGLETLSNRCIIAEREQQVVERLDVRVERPDEIVKIDDTAETADDEDQDRK